MLQLRPSDQKTKAVLQVRRARRSFGIRPRKSAAVRDLPAPQPLTPRLKPSRPSSRAPRPAPRATHLAPGRVSKVSQDPGGRRGDRDPRARGLLHADLPGLARAQEVALEDEGEHRRRTGGFGARGFRAPRELPADCGHVPAGWPWGGRGRGPGRGRRWGGRGLKRLSVFFADSRCHPKSKIAESHHLHGTFSTRTIAEVRRAPAAHAEVPYLPLWRRSARHPFVRSFVPGARVCVCWARACMRACAGGRHAGFRERRRRPHMYTYVYRTRQQLNSWEGIPAAPRVRPVKMLLIGACGFRSVASDSRRRSPTRTARATLN